MRAAAFAAFLALFLGLLFPGGARAASVTVAWDPNPPEEMVTNYTVWWGPASKASAGFPGYPSNKPCGNVTTCEIALPDGKDYYLAVTAENAFGLRSGYSEELLIKQTIYSTPLGVVRVKTGTQRLQSGVTVQFEPGGKITVTGAQGATVISP